MHYQIELNRDSLWAIIEQGSGKEIDLALTYDEAEQLKADYEEYGHPVHPVHVEMEAWEE